jgi:hypothetical protein
LRTPVLDAQKPRDTRQEKTGDRRQKTGAEDRNRRIDRRPSREPPRDNEYLCRLSAELLAFALRPGGSPEAEGSVLPEPCDIEPS